MRQKIKTLKIVHKSQIPMSESILKSLQGESQVSRECNLSMT